MGCWHVRAGMCVHLIRGSQFSPLLLLSPQRAVITIRAGGSRLEARAFMCAPLLKTPRFTYLDLTALRRAEQLISADPAPVKTNRGIAFQIARNKESKTAV